MIECTVHWQLEQETLKQLNRNYLVYNKECLMAAYAHIQLKMRISQASAHVARPPSAWYNKRQSWENAIHGRIYGGFIVHASVQHR